MLASDLKQQEESVSSDCLLDQPQKPIALPDTLPGSSYNLNRQCELAFGTGSKPCPYMQSCTKLWCTGKARGQLVCQTRHFPWADGTSCGDRNFCLKGACVERHNVTKYKVDGRWGKWGPFGFCSRTCGGGVQLAKRECNNPVPANDGKYCQGVRIKYRSCNLDLCPETGKSFREEQCEAFNGYSLNTNRLTPSVVWVPKYSGVSPKDKCKLICRANGTGYFYVLAPKDLCGATTCDTLGMADVGTMCDSKRSCSVIEDDGLPSAFTTAHELGHVFNMPHDSVKACEEVFGKLKDNHMMSPTLIQIDRSNPWSACSAAIITDFLDSGHGDCLLDQPQKPIALPDTLPGSSYNLNRQCELAFGTGSKPCPYMQSCTKLWCTGKARGQLVCQTRHFPWADGTSCGDRNFCLKGACVERHNVTKYKVDGRWGKWGPFGFCSRTCGGGVQLAKRECNNPVPANDGKYCQGVRIKYRSCNLDLCPETGKSFREEQCEAFNGYSLNTNRLTPSVVWVPKYSGVSPKDKCKLICRANGTGYFYVLAPKVVDGTHCMPDSSAVCVQGKCIKAGCDGKLSSNKKFDKCGMCGGDNRSCKKVSGLFTKPRHGYNFVVMLPAGASNIDVRQRGYKGMVSDDNYLAVKNGQGKYLLNGHYVVSAVERDITVKGSLLRYSGTTTAVETLQAFKPLLEPLTIEVLSVGKMTPPRVRYSFYLPKEIKEDKGYKKDGRSHSHNSVLVDTNRVEGRKPEYKRPMYKWAVTNWDECSVTCGDGLQRRLVECHDASGKSAASCDTSVRPEDLRICGDPCPVWEIGEWSPCSKTCGKGFKRRVLRCKTQTGLLLPRDHCNTKRKPQELDFCTLWPC
ncbi:A disintegrin and metalloproteinase with thrombospondin motifs 15 [Acipenser ruthenus]|uniref:A disintegrin and metalloproteinase with thrombospondin motifs 15 n=1 Tax=Acipenser ruthenus TaxID=7906 RepID=A0A662YRV3_ACIRT|nr:A disintegrin and metalloproteinase with thrombospondin motifs 15 [Acipenser ruthenus]